MSATGWSVAAIKPRTPGPSPNASTFTSENPRLVRARMAVEGTLLAERPHPEQTRHLFVSSCDSPQVSQPGASERAVRVPMTVLDLRAPCRECWAGMPSPAISWN